MQEKDKIERVASLPQLHEDIPLQRTAWKIQKVCWVVIVLLMIVIAAGIFGDGPLSSVRETRGSISMEYERFSRDKGEMETVIHVKGTEGRIEVRIPLDYLARFKIDKIFPETFESKISGNEIVYSFDTGNSPTLNIHFFLFPQTLGSVKGRWTVNQTVFEPSHFIYP